MDATDIPLSPESRFIVLRALTKCLWHCPDWNTQRLLMMEATRHLRILQAEGHIDPTAHLSRRIPR